MDSLWTPRIITSLDGWYYEAISKFLACNAEKTLQMKRTKTKEWI